MLKFENETENDQSPRCVILNEAMFYCLALDSPTSYLYYCWKEQ